MSQAVAPRSLAAPRPLVQAERVVEARDRGDIAARPAVRDLQAQAVVDDRRGASMAAGRAVAAAEHAAEQQAGDRRGRTRTIAVLNASAPAATRRARGVRSTWSAIPGGVELARGGGVEVGAGVGFGVLRSGGWTARGTGVGAGGVGVAITTGAAGGRLRRDRVVGSASGRPPLARHARLAQRRDGPRGHQARGRRRRGRRLRPLGGSAGRGRGRGRPSAQQRLDGERQAERERYQYAVARKLRRSGISRAGSSRASDSGRCAAAPCPSAS